MTQKHILPPNPSRMIEGLRDTGYDFNTALADIVDNSVDAGATKINVKINMETGGNILITVADNGCGMDEKTLLDGMTYGATGRDDPQRLGKFGLGLKTASTAFCRKLSVITRDSAESQLLKATWDMDHVASINEWELLFDDPDDYEIDMIEEVAERSSGTVVIWDKVDRLLKQYAVPNGAAARKALEKCIKGFSEHAAMVYQRYLDPDDSRARDIDLILNGEKVDAWDPFCISEGYTDTVANEILPAELPDGSNCHFDIKAYVLPRKENFSSDESARKARLSNDMQGIYVYRENRLIHTPSWLGMFTKEPHLTLLRVEFSFTHESDDAFQVDIKKSRILLDEGLYNWLVTKFLPAPRNAANEKYRYGQRAKIVEVTRGAHDSSNRSIQNKEPGLRNSEVEIIDAGTGEVEVTNTKGRLRLKLNVQDNADSNEVCVNAVPEIDDNLLWEPGIINQHHAVRINKGHPYYQKVYVPNLSSDVIVQGMDSLLWALVEAELSTINEATKNHFKELRIAVSAILRQLVEDLPEPDLNEES